MSDMHDCMKAVSDELGCAAPRREDAICVTLETADRTAGGPEILRRLASGEYSFMTAHPIPRWHRPWRKLLLMSPDYWEVRYWFVKIPPPPAKEAN
jgi:hypothetical protein